MTLNADNTMCRISDGGFKSVRWTYDPDQPNYGLSAGAVVEHDEDGFITLILSSVQSDFPPLVQKVIAWTNHPDYGMGTRARGVRIAAKDEIFVAPLKMKHLTRSSGTCDDCAHQNAHEDYKTGTTEFANISKSQAFVLDDNNVLVNVVPDAMGRKLIEENDLVLHGKLDMNELESRFNNGDYGSVSVLMPTGRSQTVMAHAIRIKVNQGKIRDPRPDNKVGRKKKTGGSRQDVQQRFRDSNTIKLTWSDDNE